MILESNWLKSLEPHGLLSWCLWLVSCGLLSAGLLQDVRIGVTRWMRNSTRRTTTSSKFMADTQNSGSISSARKGRSGLAKLAAFATMIPFVAVMLGASVYLTVGDRLGQHPEITKYDVYLLHVPQQMPDKEYWYTEGKSSERKLAVFCQNPPFDEGQTLSKLTFKDMGNCWQVVHRTTERDEATTLPITRSNP